MTLMLGFGTAAVALAAARGASAGVIARLFLQMLARFFVRRRWRPLRAPAIIQTPPQMSEQARGPEKVVRDLIRCGVVPLLQSVEPRKEVTCMTCLKLVLAGTLLFPVGAAAQTPPPSQPQQKPPTTEKQQSKPSQQMGQQVTLTGCLRRTSDDPKVFALVDAKPSQPSGAQTKPGEEKQGAGMAGSAGRAPFYRLEESATPNLSPHVDKRVEVMGRVTPAKDEKGADIVSITKEQTIGVTTMTIRTIDLKPAPLLNVTSVKATGDCPPAKPKQ